MPIFFSTAAAAFSVKHKTIVPILRIIILRYRLAAFPPTINGTFCEKKSIFQAEISQKAAIKTRFVSCRRTVFFALADTRLIALETGQVCVHPLYAVKIHRSFPNKKHLLISPLRLGISIDASKFFTPLKNMRFMFRKSEINFSIRHYKINRRF